MRFVDEAAISVRAGNGGHGCVSFRREKYVPKGGPDGGDGGRGGDVLFRASPRLLTLYDFRLKRRYQAQNGQPGQGKQKYGRAGQDLVIKVPVGTLIYELPSPDAEADETSATGVQARLVADGETQVWELPEEEPDQGAEEAPGAESLDEDDDPRLAPAEGETLLADLAEPGQEVVVVKGGRGGKGNTHFKSSTMRAPRFAQPGEEAEEKRIRLVLKILADAGLVGLPNAGKSTLISAISAARPKIAAYPFTTLTPNLGVMERDQDIGGDQRLVVADIPGLIEGAHEGQGLGHRFLKHVERTRFLVHLLSVEEIDPNWQESGNDPLAGFELINEELSRFDAELSRKPQILVVNKIDLWTKEALEPVARHAEQGGKRVHFISAKERWGLDKLSAAMWARLEGNV